jgi:hypothetical protein
MSKAAPLRGQNAFSKVSVIRSGITSGSGAPDGKSPSNDQNADPDQAPKPRNEGVDAGNNIRPWPGKSEPGHIRPIGPAYRPDTPPKTSSSN